MASRQEEKEHRRQERLAREQMEANRNRVLVGLPERLNKSNKALRAAELKLEAIKTLYGQRLVLKDRVVVDQIGEILDLPKVEGDDS